MKIEKSDWNPNAYLAFSKERTQPAVDLVNRLGTIEPKTIIDIGRGPGNSTSILKNRWPNSAILGIDNSPSMIEKAKTLYPDQQWEVRDIKDLGSRQYDLVFSNAVIQWIPNHNALLKKLAGIVCPGGRAAIQVPLYNQMQISKIVDETFHSLFPTNKFNIDDVFTFHTSEFYYNTASGLSKDVELWETNYYHIMNTDLEIYSMIETTGIKPYMDSLERMEDREFFSKAVKENLSGKYSRTENNKVLFPFKRMFIIIRKT